ncbi:MAG TPA: heparin lyase I family protein [Caulobacteraceae bacterium]|jgi:hypothetical protein
MITRRRLALASLASLPFALEGCDVVGRVGKEGLNNAAKPWSYSKSGHVERFEIRAGDHWKGEHSERSEAAIYRFMKTDVDVWQAYSLFIEPGPVSAAPWSIFGQWHAYKDPWDDYVSPCVFQTLVGDRFQILTASDPHIRQTHATYPPQVVRFEQKGFERGRWRHFVYRVRFNPFGKGQLQVWIDGENVVNLANIGVGYHDLVGPYFKYGVYRPPVDPSPLAARYGNMELSYESLADRIKAPLPV